MFMTIFKYFKGVHIQAVVVGNCKEIKTSDDLVELAQSYIMFLE